MIAEAAVADTSALVDLLDGDLEHLLGRAFGTLLLPRHVEDELRRRGKSRRAKLRRLLEDRVLTRCTDYPEGVIAIWQGALGSGPRNRNRGEAEALAQCQSKAVEAIFTKDNAAIRLALSQDWRVVRPDELLAAVGKR